MEEKSNWFIGSIVKLWKKFDKYIKSTRFFKFIIKLWEIFGQFIKFNLVGIVNTIITFSVALALKSIFHIHQLITYPIGYICGLINSFIMNKFWTFGKKYKFSTCEIIKFIIVNLFALGGSELIIKFAESVLKITDIWGIILGLCFSIPVNYLGFKFWVFRE